MICKRCADAADYGYGEALHCKDEKCPCQHRPLMNPPRLGAGRMRTVAGVLVGGVA